MRTKCDKERLHSSNCDVDDFLVFSVAKTHPLAVVTFNCTFAFPCCSFPGRSSLMALFIHVLCDELLWGTSALEGTDASSIRFLYVAFFVLHFLRLLSADYNWSLSLCWRNTKTLWVILYFISPVFDKIFMFSSRRVETLAYNQRKFAPGQLM